MNNKDIQLSKSLSWLLRHGAVREGFRLSPEGYLAVDQILEHKSYRGKYCLSDIERVVNNNEKRRYKLRKNPLTDALEIRAVQGHSIVTVTDAELIPILEPKYKTVIHGTYLRCWPQIRKEGLSRMNRNHVHFSKGLADATVVSGFRDDAEVLIYVDLKSALAAGLKFYESENGVILSPGNEKGYLLPKYFDRAVRVGTSELLYPLKMEAPKIQPAAVPSCSTDTGRTILPQGQPVASPPNSVGRSSLQAPQVLYPPKNKTFRQQPTPRPPQECNGEVDEALKRVIVSGFPSFAQPEDLQYALARVGSARVDCCDAYCATVSFASVAEARAALQASRKLFALGQLLVILPWSPGDPCAPRRRAQRDRREPPKQKADDPVISPKQINLEGDFHAQLDSILASVRLTQEEVTKLSSLYADLESALRTQWPGCTAVPFGSITTGLGIKGSDADCFVRLSAAQRRAAAGAEVGRARRALLQHPRLFGDVLAIPRANTPIVKLRHAPTATRCDVSFKTPLGARNSQLVGFLLHADPRLLPAAVLAKYWARVHGLAGSGRLTNYALSLLFVFYLQQPPLALLPPVAWLQREPEASFPVECWDAGFSRAPLPRRAPAAPISELLGGFFEYYALFDFDGMVVSPFVGAPVARAAFAEPALLPPELARYAANVAQERAFPLRHSTPLCVQDPFEQCHNVASAVSARLAADIRSYFKFAADAYERTKADGCRDFLRVILLEHPKIARTKAHPEYRINLFPRIVTAIANPDWKPVVRELVMAVFESMLKLKLGKVEEKVNPDSKKEKEKYSGTVTRAIWKRKQYARYCPAADLSFLQKQERITEVILNMEKQALEVQFQLTLTFCHNPRSAVITIRMGGGDGEAFKEFGKFLISIFQNWFMQLLKPYCRPNPKDTATKISETIDVLDSNVNDIETDDDEYVSQDDATAVKEKILDHGGGSNAANKSDSAELVNLADKLIINVAKDDESDRNKICPLVPPT